MLSLFMKKSKATAITSFIFGLTFWIPSLNLIFGIFAIYFGVKSLTNIKKEPDKHGGKIYAILGIILGTIVYVTFIIGFGMCVSGYKLICENIGLAFLA